MRLNRATLRGAVLTAVLLAVGCKNPFRTSSDDVSTNETKLKTAAASATGGIRSANNEEATVDTYQHEALNQAEAMFRSEKYSAAEDMFEAIADDTKNRPEVAERARYYQAESLRKQDYYPQSVDAYNRLLKDFPAGLYRERACGQMFAIANEWLQPVRDEIEDKQKPEGERRKRSWTDNIVPVNFERKLPTLSVESRALQTLYQVYLNDPSGPYADKALFMLGRVNYERQEFCESANYFQQLVETCDRSPLRDTALKMAIIAKNNSTGGPQYDARDTGEAMRLINLAKATSPTLNQDAGNLLDEQAAIVRYQQAEKDYETGELYRRLGKPGSAWLYYELVLRRYPNVKPWAEKAQQRQKELQAELDELKDPGFMASTRRFWKYYVLGYEMPVIKEGTTVPGLNSSVPTELPDTRPSTVTPPPANLPQDLRPRQ